MTADLHVHTRVSDGALTPEEVVAAARAVGITWLAITDHDSADGVPAAQARGRELGVTVLWGMELATRLADDTEAHVLAYFPRDPRDRLEALLLRLREGRKQRLLETVARLAADGIDLGPRGEDLQHLASPGRAHVARALVEGGHAASVAEAFARFLDPGRPAYVPRWLPTPQELVAAVHQAEGLAVVAHAGKLAEQALRALVQAGVDGVEAWHPEHSPAEAEALVRLAAQEGLLVTGGSDYHGPDVDRALGEVTVGGRVLQVLRQRLGAG